MTFAVTDGTKSDEQAAGDPRFRIRMEMDTPTGLIEEIAHRIGANIAEQIVTGVYADVLSDFKHAIARDVSNRAMAMIAGNLADGTLPIDPPDPPVEVTPDPDPAASQWKHRRTPSNRVLLIRYLATQHRQAIYRLRIGDEYLADLQAERAEFVTLRYIAERQVIEVKPWESKDEHARRAMSYGHHNCLPYQIQNKRGSDGSDHGSAAVVEGYNWATRLPDGLPEEFLPHRAAITGMLYLDCASPLFPRKSGQGRIDAPAPKRSPQAPRIVTDHEHGMAKAHGV
jgi:hypothetical protein